MVEGRLKQVLKTWLCETDETSRNAVEVVARDGFKERRRGRAQRRRHQVFWASMSAGWSGTSCSIATTEPKSRRSATASGDPLHSDRRTLDTSSPRSAVANAIGCIPARIVTEPHPGSLGRSASEPSPELLAWISGPAGGSELRGN